MRFKIEDCSLDAYLQLAKRAVEEKICLFPVKPKFHAMLLDSVVILNSHCVHLLMNHSGQLVWKTCTPGMAGDGILGG